MKALFLMLSLFLMVFISGCKNNPTVAQSSVSSMTEKINNSSPYDYVAITNGSSYASYSKANGDFREAYAKDGYFFLIYSSYSKTYINLTTIKRIHIYQSPAPNLYSKIEIYL